LQEHEDDHTWHLKPPFHAQSRDNQKNKRIKAKENKIRWSVDIRFVFRKANFDKQKIRGKWKNE
jgi:hypothetical protein